MVPNAAGTLPLPIWKPYNARHVSWVGHVVYGNMGLKEGWTRKLYFSAAYKGDIIS